jgi:hypothetical protein
MIRILCALICCTANLGCSQSPVLSNVSDTESAPECTIGMLTSAKAQLGTIFKLKIREEIAYITAAHSLAGLRGKDVSVTYKCGAKQSVHKVVDFENLPGIDISLLKLDSGILQMPALNPSEVKSAKVTFPSYPSLIGLDQRLASAAVESDGRVIQNKDDVIFFTTHLLRQGSSGAPLQGVDKNVLGVVLGRLLEGNIYTGIGHGLAIERVIRSISLRSSFPANTSRLQPNKGASASN